MFDLRWFIEVAFDERNELGHVLAYALFSIAGSSAVCTVFAPGSWPVLISTSAICFVLGIGFYQIGERQEARAIARRKRK